MATPKYLLAYYYPNQSRIFSEANVYGTDDRQDFLRALKIAKEKNYEVVYSTSL